MGRPPANFDASSNSSHPHLQQEPNPQLAADHVQHIYQPSPSLQQQSPPHLTQPGLQFPSQNLQTSSFDHTMQAVDFTTPQILQTNTTHIAHDPILQNPQILNYHSSMAQPTQYPTQTMPVNYYFHASLQPSQYPVHFVPGNLQAYAYAPSVPTMVAPPYQVPVQLMNSYSTAGMNNTVAWTTGLFDCMDDPLNALATVCFPCLTYGQVAEVLDNGSTSCGTSGLLYGLVACLIGCPCFLSCTYRTKLRGRYNLVESPAPDWITHFLCEWCALCQEYRELRNRGLDPSIGWQGNVLQNQAVQQHQIAMMPPTNQAMRG